MLKCANERCDKDGVYKIRYDDGVPYEGVFYCCEECLKDYLDYFKRIKWHYDYKLVGIIKVKVVFT